LDFATALDVPFIVAAMAMTCIHRLAGAALALTLSCLGGQQRADDPGESTKTARADSQPSEDSTANSEIYRNVVIAAGKSVILDSKLDFSASDKVLVTFRCTTCDSASNSMGTMTANAAWSVPQADSYSATESKAGTSFPYFDSGGAVFQVYGPQFRLILRNKGTQAIIIQQVTVFRRTP
jgi:hypothetical protein